MTLARRNMTGLMRLPRRREFFPFLRWLCGRNAGPVVLPVGITPSCECKAGDLRRLCCGIATDTPMRLRICPGCRDVVGADSAECPRRGVNFRSAMIRRLILRLAIVALVVLLVADFVIHRV